MLRFGMRKLLDLAKRLLLAIPGERKAACVLWPHDWITVAISAGDYCVCRRCRLIEEMPTARTHR